MGCLDCDLRSAADNVVPSAGTLSRHPTRVETELWHISWTGSGLELVSPELNWPLRWSELPTGLVWANVELMRVWGFPWEAFWGEPELTPELLDRRRVSSSQRLKLESSSTSTRLVSLSTTCHKCSTWRDPLVNWVSLLQGSGQSMECFLSSPVNQKLEYLTLITRLTLYFLIFIQFRNVWKNVLISYQYS